MNTPITANDLKFSALRHSRVKENNLVKFENKVQIIPFSPKKKTKTLTKSFKEWFILSSDERNLPELCSAWSKHLERYLRRIRNEADGFRDVNHALIECQKFLKFKETLDSLTINRVEGFFLTPEIMEPQMGLFSVDVNHHLPVVDSIKHTFNNTMPDFMKGDQNILDSIVSAGAEPFMWFALTIVIYGVANASCSVPQSYKKILLIVLPLMCMFNIVRNSQVLLDSVISFQTALQIAVSERTAHEERTSRKEEVFMEIVPHVSSEALVDSAGVLYAALSVSLFGLKTPESALKQITSFWHARPAIEDFVIKIGTLFESVMNSYVVDHSDNKPFRLLSSKSATYTKFAEECDAIISEYNKGSMVPTINLYGSVKALEMRMKVEYAKMSRDKNLIGSTRLFFIELQKIEQIRIYLEKRTSSSLSLRVEPVVIMFRGPPDVGKSLTTQYLGNRCAQMDASFTERETIREIPLAYQYARMSTDPFWTGYQPDNKVCILDDFDQVRDMPGMTNSGFAEFISMCSSAIMPLNMAHLDEKGSYFFRSKFVIANTNSAAFHPESIRSAAALNRRVDINVVAAPRAIYCTDETAAFAPFQRTLDHSKLPERSVNDIASVTALTPQCQEFYFTDSDGKIVDYVPMSYDQLMAKIKAKYELKKLWHLSMLKEFSEPLNQEQYDRCVPGSFARKDSDYDSESDEDVESIASGRIYSLLMSKEERDIKIIHLIIAAYAEIFASNELIAPEVALSELYELYTVELVDEELENSVIENRCTAFPKIARSISSMQLYDFSYSDMLNTAFLSAVKTFNKGSMLMKQLINYVFSPSFKKYLYMLSAIGVTYGVYRYFSSDVSEPHSFNVGDKAGKSKKEETWVNRKDFASLLKNQVVPHMGHPSDSSGSDLITSITRKNVFVVYYETGEGTEAFAKSGLAVAIKGRFVLTHYHFLTKIASKVAGDASYANARIRFIAFDASKYVCEIRALDLIHMISHRDPQIFGKDLCVFEMPVSFQPRRDIIANFALEKDYSQFKKNIDFMLVMHNGCPSNQIGLAQAMDEDVVVGSDWAGSWKIRNGYKYESTASKGDCGSLFCVMNSGIQSRKIFGLHVAGSRDTKAGFSEAISQEELIAKIEELGIQEQASYGDLDYVVPEIGTFMEQNQFNVVGRLPLKLVPGSISKTAIVKSILHDKVAISTCLPAKLRSFLNEDGDLVEPIELAKKKFCQNVASIPEYIVQSVCLNLFAHLEDCSSQDVQRRSLTDEEILYGSPGNSSMRGVNPSTSPGYPSVLLPDRLRNKTRIFSHVKDSVENLKARENYLVYIQPIIDKCKNGIRTEFLYMGKLKDEKREIEKVYLGKTRMFQVGSFDLLYLMKKYFGAFCAWIGMNRIQNGITGGINVYSQEWNFLYKKLGGRKIEPSIGAGDFASFDGSHLVSYMMGVCKQINAWYSDGNDVIRNTLFMEVVNARVIFDDLVVEFPSGLPSGNFLTFSLNSLLNHCYHASCWVFMGNVLDTFYPNVTLEVHGDDSLFSVSSEYTSVFNEHTLESSMKIMGLKYTSELKGISEKPLRFINEVNYLKRFFRFDEVLQRVLAPMKIEAVLEPINWSKKNDYLAITVMNVDSTLRELSLWEEEVFTLYQKKLVEASRKNLRGASFLRSLTSQYSTWKEITCDSEFIV